ncbi:MAG: hypothetical protein ACMG6H_02460 [Acidobacteriota bacterium]
MNYGFRIEDYAGFELRLTRALYREAVAAFSPTLPLLRLRWVRTYARGHNPDGVAAGWIPTPRVAAAATLG